MTRTATPVNFTLDLNGRSGPRSSQVARALIDAIVRQVTDDRFVRRVGHVITTRDNPSLLSMMLREAFGK